MSWKIQTGILLGCLLGGPLAAASTGADSKSVPTYPPLPEAVSSFGATVLDGYVYVYGGHTGPAHTYSTKDVTGKFHRLKIQGGSKWEELPGGPGIQGLALVAANGKIYRVGGMQPRNEPKERADNHSLASCACFDPQTNKWSSLPDMPTGRSSHEAVVLGGKIYVVGGWAMNGPSRLKRQWFDKAYVLDLSKKKLAWETIEQPFERRALAAAGYQNKLYVIGGLSNKGVSTTVNVYDPKTNKWSEGPALPKGRMNGFSPACCTSGQRMFVNPADGEVYQLDSAGNQWVAITSVKRSRFVHQMVSLTPDHALVLGGATRRGMVKSVEVVSLTSTEKVTKTSATATANGHVDAAKDESIWPGFRGNGDSLTNSQKLPLKWSAKKNFAWKVILPGYGQSSPVVWKDKVFVTAVDGKNREKGFVVAFSAKTGKELWTYKFAPTQKAGWGNYISKAAPTPVVDGEAVYSFFEGGDVLALSHEGKLLWSRSLVKDYGKFENVHSLGSSPVQTDKGIVVLVDHTGPSYLVALDKKTGKNLWKTKRKSRESWTSPIVGKVNGSPTIVVSSSGSVAGYDPKTGKQLWEMEGVSGNRIPSATVAGDYVVIGASKSRFADAPPASAKGSCCLKVSSENGQANYKLVWNTRPGLASSASPLVHQGYVYFIDRSGVVSCRELKTGKEVYAKRTPSSCWASPVGAGDYVYFFGRDGRTTVLKSGPKFKIVTVNDLWDAGTGGSGLGRKTVYGVAVVDGAIFMRTGKALYCVRS
ncbi:MAG: PQQ-binding-like beta-propeller repeat protein [Gemmataceae bacterium]